MAWLGGRLSQFSSLTDQISSFTKEVLTETTEEVEDPTAELHVAKRRVAELEEDNKHINTELEKTKLYCEELTERLETSEYQISTISQEYRRLLHDKEDELNRVKADNVKLRQENKHLVNDTTPLKELAGDGQFFDNNGGFESIDLVGGNGEWMGEYPVNDVVTSRETITQLQSELTRVRAESEHWKSQAGMNTGKTAENADVAREEIKDLQALLECERQQHEQEQLKTRQEEAGWRTKCAELEAKLTTLRQLEQVNSETATVQALNSQLEEKIITLTEEKDELEQKLAESARILEREKDAEIVRLGSEKLRLESDLRNLQSIIKNHQESMANLQEQHNQSQKEIKDLKNNIETLEGQITCREAEMNTLKQKQEETVDKEQTNTTAHTDLMASLTEVKGQLVAKETQLREVTEERDRVNRELVKTREEGDKSSRQLLQLKAHLLEVEERYTEEAVRADQREATLREEVAQLKENLQHSFNHSIHEDQSLKEQLALTQEELQTMVEQRDDALLQMSNAQEQAHQNATSLRNLQTVLEQFQRDQSSELAEALKRSQLELVEARADCSKLTSQLEEAVDVSREVGSLKEELIRKDEIITELQKELESMGVALEEEKKLKIESANVERVDSDLVKNLVLGYVHTTDAKKPEVLRLMGKILNFTDDELSGAIGSGRGKQWLWGLWSTPPSTQESLSNVFVKFLENESSPSVAPPTNTTPLPGYVDSRTDPDRPSLATATLSRPPPPKVNSPASQIPASRLPKEAVQSTILDTVLNSQLD